ncbi:MAG: hypothetical protein EA398_10115 [Deltaproteobacteria bacterium]|nr:MAG: hypothetical protein EA398_10115 [Deltaproteobacteria bacterium]
MAGSDGESLLAEAQEEDERARQERIRREAQREADTLLDTRSATGRVIQISPRFRVVGTPGFMMGLFLDPHTSHWSGGERNMAFGAEVLLRDPGRQELSFSLDWANLSMPDGYWLQRGDPVRRAEWTELDASVLNADAGIRGVRAFGSAGEWQWFYGAALGLGVVFGSAHETLVDRSRCDPMPERRSTDTSVLLPGGACFDEEGNPVLQENQRQEASWLWPVLPSVELLTGLRYVIADHYVVSVEAGLRTVYLFAGLTVGYQFQPR